MDEEEEHINVSAVRKTETRETRETGRRRDEEWGGDARKSGRKGKRGTHSLTTLHYVKHFLEDSPRSENREDVGKSCGWRWRFRDGLGGEEGGREAK
jgi:hypothetical protein